MIFEAFPAFAPTGFQVKYAVDAWEKRGAAALRKKVFCLEQGLFEDDDRDALDETAIAIVATSIMAFALDEVVGTVRINEIEKGVWQGSRLAVAPEFRRVGMLGSALIQLAVSSAHARGCTRFLANVQEQNALLFRRLHWCTLDVVELHGRPHHFMQADLRFYPPFRTPEAGFLALRKAA
jgi:putative N-acetyltransferase (TIGR04045 family)